MTMNQNLCITVKKEFGNIFKASKAVSLEKGKSHFLTRQPIKNNYWTKVEKLQEEIKNDQELIKTQNLKIKQLNQKIENYKIEKQENDDYLEDK